MNFLSWVLGATYNQQFLKSLYPENMIPDDLVSVFKFVDCRSSRCALLLTGALVVNTSPTWLTAQSPKQYKKVVRSPGRAVH